MLLSYQECLEKYGTDYKIKKSVQEGELYVKEKGIYSDKRWIDEEIGVVTEGILEFVSGIWNN